MPKKYVIVICIKYYINISHKDHFEKRHNNKNKSSRILWKCGVIRDDGIPFVIVQCQEYQCQYGQIRKCSAAKQVCAYYIHIAIVDNVLKDPWF